MKRRQREKRRREEVGKRRSGVTEGSERRWWEGEEEEEVQEEGLIVRGGAGPQFRLHTLVNEQLVVGAMLCVCVFSREWLWNSSLSPIILCVARGDSTLIISGIFKPQQQHPSKPRTQHTHAQIHVFALLLFFYKECDKLIRTTFLQFRW